MTANNLGTLRYDSDWSQQYVGDAIGVSKMTISRWENGVEFPNKERQKQLADLFNVSVRDLMGLER
ncbi:helix-turn-helix domain-containing protein [Weissella ceti]|uniref:Helix-turn-helix domain-containing protein n=1 Tax=Weissella ceti TaxID=759620 RepID=A0ABT3E491_9LACO|nr:helix-turn-helix transcriptional regulator [Weissella ceti]MCW0953225.1 helix-turn-helix domain-containing protein [Weissella ceti]QVK12741.1 helix-turn-helix transcriptional regulator [Weissella ceti]